MLGVILNIDIQFTPLYTVNIACVNDINLPGADSLFFQRVFDEYNESECNGSIDNRRSNAWGNAFDIVDLCEINDLLDWKNEGGENVRRIDG